MDNHPILTEAISQSEKYLESLRHRPVKATTTFEEMRAAFGGPMPDEGTDAVRVIEELATKAEPGLVATPGPRFFGFVIGGSHPVGLAADWLTSAWDQNSGLYIITPATAMIEQVAGEWLVELFGLPEQSSVGFVTGGQAANFTCLCAARHAVLKSHGWDVERDGLIDAPTVYVVVGENAHATIFVSLRYLGLGADRVRRVKTEDQGRMIPADLKTVLRDCDGPTIVCAQAGEINTGAFDPLDEISDMVNDHGGWTHVDGAFGLWAAVCPSLKYLTKGMEKAQSWAVDAHKWLNVPYDSGIAIVRDPAMHRGAMGIKASYLIQSDGVERDSLEYVPEFSRRARGVPVYAMLRALGRQGVVEMIERGCAQARHMQDRLTANPSVMALNDVVLNQVLVRFHAPDGGDGDEFTKQVIKNVQDEGTCWLSGTTWQGRQAMRVSFVNWMTTTQDVDRSADAILNAVNGKKKGFE